MTMVLHTGRQKLREVGGGTGEEMLGNVLLWSKEERGQLSQGSKVKKLGKMTTR